MSEICEIYTAAVKYLPTPQLKAKFVKKSFVCPSVRNENFTSFKKGNKSKSIIKFSNLEYFINIATIHPFFYKNQQNFWKGFVKNQNVLNVFKKTFLFFKLWKRSHGETFCSVYLLFREANYKKNPFCILPKNKKKLFLIQSFLGFETGFAS